MHARSKDATSETYTPVSKDDSGACLRVKADYVDGSYDTDADTDDMMFDKSMGFCVARQGTGILSEHGAGVRRRHKGNEIRA